MLLIGMLGVGLALGCRSPDPDPGDAAWWARLTQPAPADSAWPLDRLAPLAAEPDAGDGAWQLERDANGGVAVLCHAPGAAPWRALPAGAAIDFEARLRARTDPGAGERYGLAFRWQDADDYYLARVDTRNNNVRLYRRQGGVLSLLAARDLGVTVGQWHELAVRASGARLAVALDGEPLLQVTDGALSSGGVGLWADGPARVCFDGLWLIPRDAAS